MKRGSMGGIPRSGRKAPSGNSYGGREEAPGYDDLLERSPRRDRPYTSTRFMNPNLDNGGGEMRGANSYRGNEMAKGGKERHATYNREAEYDVPDTGEIPDRTNAQVGYMRPRNAEAKGGPGMSGRSLHNYALSRNRSVRER